MQNHAFVFPGQGSQSTGMLANLAEVFPSVITTFEQASGVLGYDLWDVVQNNPDDRLNQTEVTQPALLTASVAIYRLLEQVSKPKFMAGHSLGEYSALVCAGNLSFEDGVKLVKMRGEFMQQAVPAGTGAMYAIIGLDDNQIIDICQDTQNQTQQVVSAVNFNSPGQVVIAGEKQAAEIAAAACKEAGAKRALPLAVSVPSHCALMRPAAEQLADVLSSIEFKASDISVVNNVDVKVESTPEGIREALIKQLFYPVQWTRTIQYLAKQGVAECYEIGPGKVLTGLVKRIDKSVACVSVNTQQSIEQMS